MHEHDTVVLTADLMDHGLRKGDVGTIVFVHGEGEGYEVEFMTLAGATLAVVTMQSDFVRPVSDQEIATARPVG